MKLVQGFIISLSALIISFQANADSFACGADNCMIVIDAGSTGSRLHLYQYANSEPSSVKELYSNKQSSGIASLATASEEIPTYLNNLFASLSVDKSVPVYFYATAGMRLVSMPQQQLSYTVITKWFNEQGYNLKQVDTITGHEEGIYAWLAVNTALSNHNYVGVMDMGGASVQLVFPVKSTTNAAAEDLSTVTINNEEVTLYSHSFLGLGQTEVIHQYLNDKECFPLDYQLPNHQNGSGDAKSCRKSVNSLVNRVHQVKSSVASVIKEKTSQDWYVLGGLSYLIKAKPLHYDGAQFTMNQISDLTEQNICQQKWELLHSQNPTDDYLYADCLSSAYYYSLIVNGYGISRTDSINTMPKDAVSDWTRGVVMSALNKAP